MVLLFVRLGQVGGDQLGEWEMCIALRIYPLELLLGLKVDTEEKHLSFHSFILGLG